ncbi:TPA: helix-turn-helix transcriptional regulator [Proteus mirabilis]
MDTIKKNRYNDYTYDGCPVEASLELMGGKGKGMILYHLQGKILRFNELKRKLISITPRMLTKQLRELESDGLIERKVYAEIPPKVEYKLSEDGESLSHVLAALQSWGEERAIPILERSANRK